MNDQTLNVKANIPPNSVEVEKYVLGVLIKDGNYLPEELTPAIFFEPKHQNIATALLSLKSSGVAVDIQTAINEYRRLYPDADIAYCNELETISNLVTYNPEWTRLIIEKAKLRRIKTLTKSVTEYINEDTVNSDQILLTIEQELKGLTSSKRKKDGPVLMDIDAIKNFERKEDENCVIGNRWLCKGGSLLLVSQSGVGKSSFAMQFLVSLCTHKEFFGIKAKRPLRVVMLQAENDLGDVAEAYQDITGGMDLYPADQRNLDENLFIYRDTNSVGHKFLESMRTLIELHRADVILVDPLLSFAGIEVADQKQMTDFLRHGVAKVLEDTGCILVAIHHTTKPKSANDKEGQTIADLAYSGAGASELVNYVREVGVLVRQPGEAPVFKFSLTKRRGRAGMKDFRGEFKGDIMVRHSRTEGKIKWEYDDGTLSPEEQANQRNIQQTLPVGHSSNAKGSRPRSDSV
jgi:archaellum biogenesis ATPase FlaH